MAKFAKGTAVPKEETYVIGLSVVLSGSKKLTDAEKEALLSTDAVGFGLNVRGVQFSG